MCFPLCVCVLTEQKKQGGLFPGVTFYITMWYKRHECGLRMAIFFSAATAAGAFGGLLARGIVQMSGTAGLAGWSWIFILEGIVTFVVGESFFFCVLIETVGCDYHYYHLDYKILS